MMRRALAGFGVAVAVGLAATPVAFGRVNYATGGFTVKTNPVAFGQAPVFLPNGQVLFGQDYKQGEKNQVYIENWNGTGLKCLTCTGDPVAKDPNNINGVPTVQPAPPGTPVNDLWVVFHSWRGHYMTIGSPGYGGMGSALWAMHPDGSDQTQVSDVFPASATPGAGEGIDDYHAYWSPDGKQIEYAHLNWNFITGGGSGKWDVRVADFNVGAGGKPGLSNIRVVRPANGHWYETQWWNPNPKHPGFLYTESYPEAASGGGASVPQDFYCQLVKHETACKVHRLTDNASWDEQSIFTPDGRHVLFMSSRARDGIFNAWANLTRTLGIPSDYDYLLILPIFEAGFLQPVGQESTDLYELPHPFSDPSDIRRLTTDGNDGWITPEFGWDPSKQCLVWTENRFPDGYRYQLPQGVTGWIQQLTALAKHPPNPAQIVDVGQNGVGVAPLPVQQRTQIGSFDGSSCRR
jgi:hypothetical protein